jgi:Uma2 family endonuclease
MAPKGNRHENVKTKLLNWILRRLPDELEISIELGWRPNQDTYLEPDILIFNNVAEPSRVAPSDVLLAVEIAASSFGYDVGRKSQVYAELGIKDYWVIDAQTLTARVFREPSGAGYQSVVEVPADGALVPLLVVPLALKLADLKIG